MQTFWAPLPGAMISCIKIVGVAFARPPSNFYYDPSGVELRVRD